VWQPADWYTLPRWYDAIYAPGTKREADFLEALVERHGRVGRKRALEPACGSARLVAELARRGWRVNGFDASPAMLEYGRKRLARRRLSAQLLEARLEQFPDLGRHELAYCLVSSFKYVLDERSAAAHLRAVAQQLIPGGLYVLGIDLSEYDTGFRWKERWTGRSGAAHVTNEVVGEPAQRKTRREAMRSRLTVRRAGQVERYETHWQFRTYDLAELRRLIAHATEFEHVATHDYDHDPARAIAFNGAQLDNVLVLRRRP
jgi:SAM-dependent methyltransferase